jgi:hypothetical protein
MTMIDSAIDDVAGRFGLWPEAEKLAPRKRVFADSLVQAMVGGSAKNYCLASGGVSARRPRTGISARI